MRKKLTIKVFRGGTLLFIILSLCCLIFFSISSCKKAPTSRDRLRNTAPLIDSISPQKGPGLTEVTIYGARFSTVPEENKVTINGKDAIVIQATANKLIVLVPMQAGTGPVMVQLGSTVTGPYFEYEWTLVINTLAGGFEGFADGIGENAQFNVDASNSTMVTSEGFLYITDEYNDRIRKVTPEGMFTTFAGSSRGYVDGHVSVAKFDRPISILAGPGGVLYVGEKGRIRKITPNGIVSTLVGGAIEGFADGQGAAAKFTNIVSMAIDINGNIYAIDLDNSRIRKITSTGMVTTFAGGTGPGYRDGPGAVAKFCEIGVSFVIDSHGNFFMTDPINNCIRKITPNGTFSTYTGVKSGGMPRDGLLAAARFGNPYTITIDSKDNLYVADWGSIRKISTNGEVSTIAGIGNGYASGNSYNHVDGPALTSRIAGVRGIAFSPDERIIYFTETFGGIQTVRRMLLQ